MKNQSLLKLVKRALQKAVRSRHNAREFATAATEFLERFLASPQKRAATAPKQEVPVKLCLKCQAAYPMGAWQQLELLEASAERTTSGRYPKTEKRRCSQCAAELTLELQHYEDHDYTVPPRVAPLYDRIYGP